MRVLLLHPNDHAWSGEWSAKKWDLIVDLAFASSFAYGEWSRGLGARVLSIYKFAGQMESYRWVNQIFELGRGRLLDRVGLDWWEILAMESYQHLQLFYFLNQLRPELSAVDVEISSSRPHLFAKIVEETLRKPVHYFQSGGLRPVDRATRMLQSVKNLRPAQITEIALDKWDSEYRLRRAFQPKRAKLSDPAMLLPSAYSNVTRSTLAYAAQLPNRKFLLATTRRSATPGHLPENVTSTTLAAYAQPAGTIAAEAADLRKSWTGFLRTMSTEAEIFQAAAGSGVWNYFPAHLRNGLLLRESWKNLLESEPIGGVLCGDDLNYHTRLPLILAARNGLRAIYCSHGALDGGFLFKKPVADTFLVKGEMERDYLQKISDIRAERIVVAAPGTIDFARGSDAGRDALVFFSQPYEVISGRPDSIYGELLPGLSSVARNNGRKLVIKLHPFESRRGRQALVNSILAREAQSTVEIVDGRPPEEVMARAWCGITMDSSVTVECSLRRIPFFLCGWLDFSGMGYLHHFEKYGAGSVLEKPQDILSIPQRLIEFKPDPAKIQRLWQAGDRALLDQTLFGARVAKSQDICVG